MTFASGDPLCLYSVFLAKLVSIQRRLAAAGGTLALAGLSENAQHIFEAAGLHKFFVFYPDVETAAKEMS
jgi:anti-anti-sigma regulatory factor